MEFQHSADAHSGSADGSRLHRKRGKKIAPPCKPESGRFRHHAAHPASAVSTVRSRYLTAINDGLSSFNAVSVRIEKRFSRGLYFLGNYQFSKNIDTNSGETDNAIAYRTNTRLNRAVSAFDQSHRAVISAGYELPFGNGKPWLNKGGVSSFIIGGWQVQGIVSLLTGMPFTPSGPFVCSCGSYIPQWVNAVKPGFGNLSNPAPNMWYDKTAFALPPIGFQGNAGRNVIRGPGRNDLDISIFKSFPITERMKVQFRAEFFNVTNHPSFGFPDGNISNVTAGVISSAYDGEASNSA